MFIQAIFHLAIDIVNRVIVAGLLTWLVGTKIQQGIVSFNFSMYSPWRRLYSYCAAVEKRHAREEVLSGGP